MHEDDKIYERVSEDDPNRCQGRGPHGQCTIKAIEGSQYCINHGGQAAIARKKKDELHNLQITQFKGRLVKLAHNTEVMNLRDEIGVSRLVLENFINKCEGATDLLTFAPQIARQTESIAKLVRDCHYIESKLGNLLDKGALMQFAAKMIDIITEYVEDNDTKKLIAMKVVAIAEELNNEQ